MTIETEVRTNLMKAGFTPDDLLLVGVSGGPDSLALANALCKLNWKMAFAHFDHQLRPESARDCNFVKQMAADLGLDFYQSAKPIQKMAEEENRSIEEMARTQRYHFLFQTAQHIHARAVLIAHTADDQVETVLMHILRGSGLNGLTGMHLCSKSAFHPSIPLVRPLLNTWREEIDAYCKSEGLVPVQDASNQDRTYFRNRVRHELIPLLETYNPAVKANVLHLADIVQDDWDFLEKSYGQISAELIRSVSEDTLEIQRSSLLAQEKGAQKAVIQNALSKLRESEQDQIDFATIMAVVDFAHQPTIARHISLPNHLHTFLENERLVLTKQEALSCAGVFPQCNEQQTFSMVDPFQVKISPDFFLTGKIEPVENFKKPDWVGNFLWEAYLDADAITSAQATIRPFYAGDRFAPLGMGGKQIKVSDFFTNKKVPVALRKKWPLLVINESVLWITGFQPAHAARLHAKTSRIWHLQLQKIR